LNAHVGAFCQDGNDLPPDDYVPKQFRFAMDGKGGGCSAHDRPGHLSKINFHPAG